MIERLIKLGGWGGLGFLIGILMVIWIEPSTFGGTALIVIVCTIVFTVIGLLISAIIAKINR